ncbi:MAG: ergothioneine biosynthesis protein EgtB [Gammaproteobacteria bacterium]|nr:ergothioneine biosynthesis protein EgtB [Gammaproteobacteria bacterium]
MPAPGNITRVDFDKASSPINSLLTSYQQVRKQSEILCQKLEIEDYGIQTFEDVSPPKWHLAHVSWFFETFLLKPYVANYRIFHPEFAYLFNSYYETAGSFHPRPERGLLSRPTVKEVYQYRAYVDEHMNQLLTDWDHEQWRDIDSRTWVGIHHEQQHQELLLTDIKYNFAYNPLRPIYNPLHPTYETNKPSVRDLPGLRWIEFDEDLVEIGYKSDGFCYDNELPLNKVFLAPYKLASCLVTNGEFIEFIEARGYQTVRLWLSDAWKTLRTQNWRAPLYWEKSGGQWCYMTLSGMQEINEHAPVCHVSFYEADAYARWKGKRLPTEAEWEVAAKKIPITGNFLESGYLQPITVQANDKLAQMFGDVWEWTQSPYTPYSGYQPLKGTLGEYNGKFMSNQIVLRGGSCLTSKDHIRASYRNFFYPKDRWQCSGFRLAK